MSLKHLIAAAMPAHAAALNIAGASTVDVNALVAETQEKMAKEAKESVVDSAVAVFQGVDAIITAEVTAKAARAKLDAASDKKIAEGMRVKAYFSANTNLFPARKFIGIPTPAEALAASSDIDKIPEGWAAPVAASAAASAAA